MQHEEIGKIGVDQITPAYYIMSGLWTATERSSLFVLDKIGVAMKNYLIKSLNLKNNFYNNCSHGLSFAPYHVVL